MALKRIPIPPKAPEGLEKSWTFLNRLFTNLQRRLPRYRFHASVLVELDGNQSIPNSAGTAISWGDTIHDDEDLWDGANPTRLTVPTGFDGRAYLSTNIQFAKNATGLRYAVIQKNGSNYKGGGYSAVSAPDITMGINAVSALVNVTEGDYFEVRVFQDSGGSVNVEDAVNTWFHMILYEKSAK